MERLDKWFQDIEELPQIAQTILIAQIIDSNPKFVQEESFRKWAVKNVDFLYKDNGEWAKTAKCLVEIKNILGGKVK